MQQKLNLYRRLIFFSIFLLSSFIINAQDIWQDVSENSIISSNLDTIEGCGGGSARCMIAEMFLKKNN
mgnify:CR=1 FL=1